ncbi:LysM peptidoglycan-binding domain-containing protein [Listeria sp. PSOL-1]|uniref:LysM peptidoglycan-binding domain-containing protein n=1 Tax=Listeria sp. PSOL-1 TaxID=1844999 RepID=UPI0013D03CB5|nr:LysM peptidoglycan-binding domain-containing protein [Listeria sp. PSOL-1]
MARKSRNGRNYHSSEDDQKTQNDSEKMDEFNNESPMLSRSDSRRGKKKTVFRYPLLNILIIFFLLIPIVIIVVFLAVQHAGTSSNASDEPKSSVEVKKNDKAKEKADQEKAAEEKAKKEKAEKADQEKKAKEEEKIAAEKNKADQAQKEQQEQAEQRQKEEQQQADALKKQREQEAAAEQKKQQEAAQNSAGSHTVQQGETLWRIATNAYGGAGAKAGVEKIKQANGLSGNSVPVGTKLKIPK